MDCSMIKLRRLAGPAAAASVALAALAGCATTATPLPGPSESGGAPASSAAPSTPPAPESNPPGDIPDNQAFVPYGPASGGFQVKVPEGWAQTNTGGGTAFTDKLNSITITRRDGGKQPTTDSVAAAVRTAEGPRSGFAMGKASTVDRPAGTAIRVVYRVDGPADPVTGKIINDDVELYVFWRQGVEVDLRLSGPHGADNVDPWKIITDSFRWTA